MIARGLLRLIEPRGVFAKLVTVFLVIGLVPFLGMSFWTYQTAKQRMTETVIGYWLVRLARETAVQLDQELERMRDLVFGWAEDEAFARDIPLCQSSNKQEAARALQRLKAHLRNRHQTRQDQIDYMFVVDRHCHVLADSLPGPAKGAWQTPLLGQDLPQLLKGQGEYVWLQNALAPRPQSPGEGHHQPTLSALDWHRSPLLFLARHGTQASISELGPSLISSDYALGFAGSVSTQGSQVPVGAVGVVFNWRRIQGILDQVQQRFREKDAQDHGQARYDTGYGFLFASDRDTIIAHKRAAGSPESGERSLLHSSLTRDHGLDVFSRRMAEQPYGFLTYQFPPGTSKISGFAHMATASEGGFGWYVGMGINDDQIYADVLRLKRTLIICALIVTGLVILGAAIFSHRITEPITRLITFTAEVARGNQDARVDVGTKDEIAVLAGSFSRMVADLQESNRRLVEAEKNAAWQEMARQVAHEIKNPLTPIKLSAQQIAAAHRDRHPDFKEILDESVNSIIEQCEHMGKIASDFAAFAAFTDRTIEEQQLVALVEGVVGPYLAPGDASPVKTRLQADIPTETSVRVDSSEMRRVFLNIITNSINAMGEKGGDLMVRISLVHDAEQTWARIAFRDSGCGIPDEDRAHLFEPYFSTRTGGTGLGLALCKKIVQAHGGHLEVQSQVGQGTTMTIVLPVVPAG